nr:MAG TPA_asm: hypothetical protein [Caudoviricetes sp.]
MTCGKDRNESKIAVCSLCLVSMRGTFFTAMNTRKDQRA